MLVKAACDRTSGARAMRAGSTNSPSHGKRNPKKAIPNPRPAIQASRARSATAILQRKPKIATGAMKPSP